MKREKVIGTIVLTAMIGASIVANNEDYTNHNIKKCIVTRVEEYTAKLMDKTPTYAHQIHQIERGKDKVINEKPHYEVEYFAPNGGVLTSENGEIIVKRENLDGTVEKSEPVKKLVYHN